GRGSFTESFPLFGYDMRDYEALFEEKLDLFAELRKEQPVTWSGTMRPALQNADVFPKTEGGGLRTSVGVGGSPQSVIRVARYGFGLTLAIIGGAAARFAPLVELYHRAVDSFGTERMPISAHSPGHIAETDADAWEQAYPGFEAMNSTIGRERGWPAYSRAQFQNDVGPMGAVYSGSPDRVAAKIADTVRVLGLGRFELKYATGTTPHAQLLRSIELYATEVVPRVRRLLAD
ncbi:MAG: LLM class flavin-dependent oxidoreductase, partial [Microbacterium sp.]